MSKHRVEAYVTATVREFWDVELPDRWAEFDADEQREFLMLAAGGGGDMDALGEVWKVTGADVGLEDEIIDTSDREWTLNRVTALPAPSPEAGAMSTADGLGTDDRPGIVGGESAAAFLREYVNADATDEQIGHAVRKLIS